MTPDRIREILKAPAAEHLAEVNEEIRLLEATRILLESVLLPGALPGNALAPSAGAAPRVVHFRPPAPEASEANRAKIVAFFGNAGRPVTIAEIVIATGLSQDTVRSHLRRIDVEHTGRGRAGEPFKYTLKPPAEQVPAA